MHRGQAHGCMRSHTDVHVYTKLPLLQQLPPLHVLGAQASAACFSSEVGDQWLTVCEMEQSRLRLVQALGSPGGFHSRGTFF